MTFNTSNSNSLGNDYADMLIGNLNSFTAVLVQPRQRHLVRHV